MRRTQIQHLNFYCTFQLIKHLKIHYLIQICYLSLLLKKLYEAGKIWLSPFIDYEVRAQKDEMTALVPQPGRLRAETKRRLWLDCWASAAPKTGRENWRRENRGERGRKDKLKQFCGSSTLPMHAEPTCISTSAIALIFFFFFFF